MFNECDSWMPRCFAYHLHRNTIAAEKRFYEPIQTVIHIKICELIATAWNIGLLTCFLRKNDIEEGRLLWISARVVENLHNFFSCFANLPRPRHVFCIPLTKPWFICICRPWNPDYESSAIVFPRFCFQWRKLAWNLWLSIGPSIIPTMDVLKLRSLQCEFYLLA